MRRAIFLKTVNRNVNFCSNMSGRQPPDDGWIQLKQVEISTHKNK
jgi:hypothetical protein